MATVPLTEALVQPRDRVVYADHWQGTLDSPSAEDLAWLAGNPGSPDREPEPFEPSDADWDDLYGASYGFGDDDIQAAGLAVG